MSKKGVITFVFSKLAFLIFGIVIVAAFFYFVAVQQNIQGLDRLAQSANGISNVAGIVSASPFNVSIEYNVGISGEIYVENQSFILKSGNRELRSNFNFPISSGIVEFEGCLLISKSEKVVISNCQ